MQINAHACASSGNQFTIVRALGGSPPRLFSSRREVLSVGAGGVTIPFTWRRMPIFDAWSGATLGRKVRGASHISMESLLY